MADPTWREDLDNLIACCGEAQWVEEADERLTAQLLKLDRYRWISVAERVPDHSSSVLVAKSDGFVDKTSYYRGEFILPSLEPHVTHWMPLPEAPQ